jgi:outer membrane murein-binding lipoprotein Lpp
MPPFVAQIFFKYVLPVLVIAGIFVGLYFYWDWSTKKISELETQVTTLSVTVQTQKITIEAIQKDMEAQAEINKKAVSDINNLKAATSDAIRKIQAANLGKVGQTKPREVETGINKDTSTNFDIFENLTKRDFNATPTPKK